MVSLTMGVAGHQKLFITLWKEAANGDRSSLVFLFFFF